MSEYTEEFAEEAEGLIASIFDAIESADETVLESLLIQWAEKDMPAYIRASGVTISDECRDNFATAAADAGDKKVLRILHKGGIDLSESAPNHWTAATWAASEGLFKVLKRLDRLGYSLYSPNQDGDTPLEVARSSYKKALDKYEKALDAERGARLSGVSQSALEKLQKSKTNVLHLLEDLGDTANFLEDYETSERVLAMKKQDMIHMGFVPEPQ